MLAKELEEQSEKLNGVDTLANILPNVFKNQDNDLDIDDDKDVDEREFIQENTKKDMEDDQEEHNLLLKFDTMVRKREFAVDKFGGTYQCTNILIF